MVIFAISHEPLNGALGVSGGHEYDVTGFSALRKLFVSHCILFLIYNFLGLHKSNFGRANVVLDYTTDILLPQTGLLLGKGSKNNGTLILIDFEGEGEVGPSEGRPKLVEINATAHVDLAFIFKKVKFRKCKHTIADL
jgi:hypothetical protein